MNKVLVIITLMLISFRVIAEFEPNFKDGVSAFISGDYETATLHLVKPAMAGHAVLSFYLVACMSPDLALCKIIKQP